MARQTAEMIEEEAAEWLARIDRHGETAELMQGLSRWLDGDARREGALVQAQAALALLNDHFSSADEQTGPSEGGRARRALASRRQVMWAGASALAASLAAGVVFWPPGETYRTRVGEVRRIRLDDGSVAAINTQSIVDIELKPDVRVIRVVRGEAWFQVARNKQRPFVAEAGRVRVQAVGTAFSVRRHDSGADVLVTEGVVDAWADGAEGHKVRLAAGQRAFVADNAAIELDRDAPASVDRALAWRSGQIDLDGEPLVDAIEEFNRYNERKLVLADPALAKEPLFGVFRIDDPEGFATAVRHGLAVPVRLSEPGRIVIGEPQ